MARALDPSGDGRLREEIRVRWQDGSDHWLAVTAQVKFGDEPLRALSMAGMAADITERKRVEEALQRASAESARWRRLYEAVLANTPDLGYVFNLDHRFVFANDALLAMWGKQWEEAIGKNCLELGYEPWHAEMHDREIEQVIATRQPVRGVVPFNGTHGRRIYDYIFFPVIGTNGEVEAVGGTTRDITDIKNAEQALRENAERIRQSEKLAVVGRLASSIAHEINNPLEAVTNLVYLARRETTPSLLGQFLEQAQEELERVSLITRETLRFHRQNSSPARVDLAGVMDSVLRLYQGRLHSAQVGVERRYRHHPEVVCLPDEIRQVLANLVGNAVDAMTRNTHQRRLCLGMAAATRQSMGERGLRITVADNGSGISPEARLRIFEPFFTTKESTGTGLGLWVSHEIVKKHGGDLRFRSSAGSPHGTVFTVFLPEAGRAHDAQERLAASENFVTL